MHKSVKLGIIAGTIFAAGLFVTTTPAKATVITLSGGDPGEGFNPLSGVYAAKDFSKAEDANFVFHDQIAPQGNLTVQNVTFNTNLSAIAGPAINPYPTTDMGFWGGSVNDSNMAVVVRNVSYYFGDVYLTISGLSAGRSYQFDLFSQVNGSSSRPESMTYSNSAGAVLFSEPSFTVANGVQAYDVVTTLVAPSDGIIIIDVGGQPLLSALAVTYMVPEPSTALLFGLGGLFVWRRVRQSRRKCGNAARVLDGEF